MRSLVTDMWYSPAKVLPLSFVRSSFDSFDATGFFQYPLEILENFWTSGEKWHKMG